MKNNKIIIGLFMLMSMLDMNVINAMVPRRKEGDKKPLLDPIYRSSAVTFEPVFDVLYMPKFNGLTPLNHSSGQTDSAPGSDQSPFGYSRPSSSSASRNLDSVPSTNELLKLLESGAERIPSKVVTSLRKDPNATSENFSPDSGRSSVVRRSMDLSPLAARAQPLPENFEWRHFGAVKIGFTATINPDFVDFFSTVNVGAVLSFASRTKAENAYFDTDLYTNQVRPLVERMMTLVGKVNAGSANHQQAEALQAEVDRLKSQSPVNILSASIRACKDKRIGYRPLFFSLDLDEESLNAIKEEIKVIENTISAGKNVVIVTDQEIDKTIVLLSCWLISRGTSVEVALVKANSSNQDVNPACLALIQAFVRSINLEPVAVTREDFIRNRRQQRRSE